MKQPAITGATKLIAIFGWPLSYTLSPRFQNAGLAAAGLDAVYLPFPVEQREFPSLLRSLARLPQFLGANVTNPHKLSARRLAQALTPEARAIGAVNTLYRKGGRLIGHNTDAAGFSRSLKRAGFRAKGRKVLILGAGGAARAVAYACSKAGAAQITVACRRPAQGRELARMAGRRCKVAGLKDLARLAAPCQLLVNTIPGAGFAALAGQALPRGGGMMVCDISYRTPGDPLLGAARRRGHKALSGLEMLLEQGVLSFERFTGRKAPYAAMRKALFAA